MISINHSQIRTEAGLLSAELRPAVLVADLVTVLLFILLFTVLSLFSVNAFAESVVSSTGNKMPRDPMEHFFHQSFNDLAEELDIVAEENKKGVFIMFTDKDCPWCAKMKVTVMNQVAVQDYYQEHFRVLTIDIRGDAMIVDFDGNEISEKDFAFKQHRVRATPVVMFFDTSGKKMMRFTGIVRDVKEFLWMGEYVVNDEFKKMNFTKYKRERKKQDQLVTLGESS
ncbi:MAG: thioredoxin [Gammaproteobacteria bacterium]|nr:MAG: thioredoxin [Gammaproteobacteria bacterium]